MSFIFSSNNNIKRITKGLDSVRSKYGDYSCTIRLKTNIENKKDKQYWEVSTEKNSVVLSPAPAGPLKRGSKRKVEPPVTTREESQNETCVHLYTFPSVSALSSVSEEAFRAMGYVLFFFIYAVMTPSATQAWIPSEIYCWNDQYCEIKGSRLVTGDAKQG